MPRSLLLLLAPALALSAGPASAQAPSTLGGAPRCSVQGTSVVVGRAEIHPRGVAPFTLEVRGAEVEARPPRGGDLHRIEVRAGLRFSAESPGAALPYRLTRPVPTAHGMVELSPEARLARVRAWAGGVRVEAEPTDGVHLLGLELPCDALALGGPEPRAEQPTGPPSTAIWSPRRRRLVFHASPRGGATLTARVDLPSGWQLREEERRGGWLLLLWSGSGGSRVRGWVPRAEVEPAPGVVYGGSIHGLPGGCGRGLRGSPEIYRGPARVHEGAEVFAAPGRGPWATASSSEPLQVVHTRGEAWVRISAVPLLAEAGECGELAHAWVRLTDVELPPDAHPAAPPAAAAPGN